MAEVATKSKPVAKPPETGVRAMPTARLVGVVDRTARLSDEVLKTLETRERAAIEAVGQFVITLEEALPREVAGTSEVAKMVTESGLGMADRLVDTQYGLLRDVVKSAAHSFPRVGEKSVAA